MGLRGNSRSSHRRARRRGEGRLNNSEENAMRSNTRAWVVMLLAGAFVITWRAQTDQDVVVAQARKPIMMTRILHRRRRSEPRRAGGDEAQWQRVGNDEGDRRGVQPAGPGARKRLARGPEAAVRHHSQRARRNRGRRRTKSHHRPRSYQPDRGHDWKGTHDRNIGPDDRIVVTIPLADQTVSRTASR